MRGLLCCLCFVIGSLFATQTPDPQPLSPQSRGEGRSEPLDPNITRRKLEAVISTQR